MRSWTDALHDALALVYAPEKVRGLFERYREAFSQGFQEIYAPAIAASDIRIIEALTEVRPLAVDFSHRNTEERQSVSLRVWSFGRPLPLSERVPVLENMGFTVVDERTYRIAPQGAAKLWFHDMLLERRDGGTIDLDDGKDHLEAAFLMVMRGQAENDGYNALTLAAGLAWREVALLRTLSRFLRQVRVPYSQDYMWTTLTKHSAIAVAVVELFYARFDPRPDAAQAHDEKQKEIAARIEDALQKVDSLDEDRILRHFVNAVQVAIRTNFYQTDKDGLPKALIAIKFESAKITDLPLPRPLYEIFVYSPRVEGVHLRFGKVARGGIRWSDRPQDFRTEILGLVKAQQVKNAVIVPVGAKGGFVPKLMPKRPTREQFQAEGIATYKLFISTLLDITDNIHHDGTIVPPDCVVRHEGDDPYLVVAADKGTATFSDIANALSIEHDYWLGDAFASGGSAGYDHKVMGITARGAWESVKRHFREMDVNIHETPFTCVGVGDMSGDVFGNGMLREQTTRLLAAFDHRDIFIDPDPDPAKAFAERQRLFNLPRSSWQDYDKSLISDGGGVYPRSSKEIRLSPAAQKLFGVAGGRDAAGVDEGDPQGASRPAVLRRHRHLCAFVGRERRSGRRPRQRCHPRHRQRSALQGGRRGRQSRHDPARPHRGGARRHQAQHRRHRQLRRRQYLRRRGQHQDRVEPPAARWHADASSAQCAARRNDATRSRAWCCATTISRRWRFPWRSGAALRTSAFSSA